MPDNRRIVTPDLTSYIQGRKGDIKTEMNCVAIGTVVDFDPTNTQTLTVQINYVRVLLDAVPTNAPNTDQTTTKTLPYPQLVRCPLMILTGGPSYMTFPVENGDECVIFFNDRDLDTWWSTGAVANPPNSNRLHDLNDGIVFVGVRSLANKISLFNMLGPEIGNGLAKFSVEDRIKISVAGVTLGVTIDALMVQLIAIANAIDNPDIAAALAAIQLVFDGILK